MKSFPASEKNLEKAASLTMAVIVVLLGAVSTVRRVTGVREQSDRQMATAIWEQYQDNRVLYDLSQLGSDILREKSESVSARHAESLKRESGQSRILQEAAQHYESSASAEYFRGSRLRTAQFLLEAGLLFAAVAVWKRSRPFWLLAIFAALFGILFVASTEFWLL